jgi:predicted RNA-binding protein with EMAP domain
MSAASKKLSVRIHTMGEKTVKVGKRTYKGLKSQTAHNQRTETMEDDYLLNPGYEHLNIFHNERELNNIQNDWEDVRSDYQAHYKRNMPSNAKPYLDGLITFSKTMFEDMLVDGKLDREEMMEAVKGFLREEFGKSFVNVQLHTGETTPHFHFTTLNYDWDRKLAYSSAMRRDIKSSAQVKGQYQKNELQDRFADYMTKTVKGFDYERGSVHSIKAYHDKRSAQDKHIKDQRQTIVEHLKTIEDMSEEIVGLNAEVKYNEQQVEQLSAQIVDLGQQADNLSGEVIADIETILADLLELDRMSDGQKFMELVKRYVGSSNQSKLDKLISKWKGGLAKAKSRRTEGLVQNRTP